MQMATPHNFIHPSWMGTVFVPLPVITQVVATVLLSNNHVITSSLIMSGNEIWFDNLTMLLLPKRKS